MHADVPNELDVVQVHQPVRVVHHQRLGAALLQPVAELDETAHLLFEALAVVVDGLFRHHGAQVAPAGRVANHARAAANQRDRPVPRHLQPLHQAQCHEMPYVQAVRRGVEADVERGLSVVDQFLDLLFIRQLGQKASRFQFVEYCHFPLSFSLCDG